MQRRVMRLGRDLDRIVEHIYQVAPWPRIVEAEPESERLIFDQERD